MRRGSLFSAADPCYSCITFRPLKKQELDKKLDTTLYPNRWIAIVRGRVIGVGMTAQQAYRAAKRTRPKDKPALYFVDVEGEIQERGSVET